MRNTPIIESGAVGAALGLALDGFRPMVEMQFGDFITCGFNQIVNNLAKTHYRWGARGADRGARPRGRRHGRGAVPLPERRGLVHARGRPEGGRPRDSYDAKGLLTAAFEDGNPVLYLEHKLLYRSARGRDPSGWYTLPLGRGAGGARRDGRDDRDLFRRVSWALEAAERMAADGRSIEVIDLRTAAALGPRDRAAIGPQDGAGPRPARGPHHRRLRRRAGGGDRGGGLRRPRRPRVAAGRTGHPVPFSKALEEVFSPRARLLPALRELLAY